MIPAKVIDDLIEAARQVGAGSGRIDEVIRQRADLLAWMLSRDVWQSSRADAIRVCEELDRRMESKTVSFDLDTIPAPAKELATRAIRTFDRGRSVDSWHSSLWSKAAELLDRGWSP